MEGKSCTVLLIEDEPGFRQIMAEVLALESRITKIFQAGTLTEGLQLLERETIDVTVTDLRLPDSDGAETVERITGIFPEAIVLVVTGLHLHSRMVDDLIIAGAFGFISKTQLFNRSLVEWVIQAHQFRKAVSIAGRL